MEKNLEKNIWLNHFAVHQKVTNIVNQLHFNKKKK